ncbi:MAG: 50S ribosomal protein L9 [Planctomycetaceae bacterium]|nr:50S ribosomal protein L9 [Planctomycetaceae bacterium]
MATSTRIRSKEHRGGVELLLAENVPALGEQGEIVRVKRGYARNYLIPHGLATVATEANKRMVELHRQRQDELAAKKIGLIKKLADEVSKYSVTIEANATDEGHLYGSVLAADISKSLKAANFPVEPEHIKLDGPLKELGMYTVKLQLHPTIDSDVKVWVVPAASMVSGS